MCCCGVGVWCGMGVGDVRGVVVFWSVLGWVWCVLFWGGLGLFGCGCGVLSGGLGVGVGAHVGGGS